MNTDQRIELVSKIAGAIAAQHDNFGPGAASQVSVWVSMAEAIVSDAEARAVERTARLLKTARFERPGSASPPPQSDDKEASENATQNPADPSDEELLEKAAEPAA